MLSELMIHPEGPRVRDIAVAAGRYRLKPVIGGWPTTEQVATSAARLFVPSQGGAIRTVISGRVKHQTTIVNSRKNNRTIYVEGRAEKDYARLSETAWWVIEYQPQAYRMEVVVDGVRYVQIVDMTRELASGELEVIEVKRDEDDLIDPDYRRKLAVTGEVFAGLGFRPRVVLHSEMFQSRLHRQNVNDAYSARFASVSPDHLRLVRCLRAQSERELPLGRLWSLLEPHSPERAKAVAYALLIRREIAIDLTAQVTPHSIATVLPTPQPPSGKMRIN